MWHLNIFGVNNQERFLRSIDVNGEKFCAAEVWGQVRQVLPERGLTHRGFAQAMNTKFCGPTMWKHSPSRGRLHRAAAVLDDQELHDLATNDVFWDRVVEIVSIGEQDAYAAPLSGTQNFLAPGVCSQTGQ